MGAELVSVQVLPLLLNSQLNISIQGNDQLGNRGVLWPWRMFPRQSEGLLDYRYLGVGSGPDK